MFFQRPRNCRSCGVVDTEISLFCRKGTLHPISISIKMRQGRKAVTLITNYEPYFLAADVMSEDLRKLCAAQTSGRHMFLSTRRSAIAHKRVVALVNGKPNQYEVLVQGKQGKAVSEYLMGKGVPKKWIQLEDTTEKKKGR
jgi:translation initiation factor 2D